VLYLGCLLLGFPDTLIQELRRIPNVFNVDGNIECNNIKMF